ncbi:MAG: tripartite tricarboxylate transporter substrate-binding protein [Castellaniella sp.]
MISGLRGFVAAAIVPTMTFPAGGGIVGMIYTARAQLGSYTLIVTSQGLASVNASFYPDFPYATLQDFAPVSTVAEFSLVMVVKPNGSVNTIDELRGSGIGGNHGGHLDALPAPEGRPEAVIEKLSATVSEVVEIKWVSY